MPGSVGSDPILRIDHHGCAVTDALPLPSTDPAGSAPAGIEVPSPAATALLERLVGVPGMERGRRRLVLQMCAGIGSHGILAEVLRGYTGDRTAPQCIADDETIQKDDTLLYSYRERGILGFSATMARPLSFLDPYLT